MLDFEEELKKFQPSLEVEELGDAIYQDDLTDMTDLLREVIVQTKQDAPQYTAAKKSGYSSQGRIPEWKVSALYEQ